MSWKRKLESWVVSQSHLFKINLSIVTVGTLAFGSIALAHTSLPIAKPVTTFEVYQAVKGAPHSIRNSALSGVTDSSKLASSIDETVDYIQEVYGTKVPPKTSPEEAKIKALFSEPIQPALPSADVEEVEPTPTKETILGPVIGHAYVAHTFPHFSGRNLLWPMRGGYVSSRFGMRWGRMHEGTDIAAPMGAPILAAADGTVVFSGWESGYGQLVILDHGNGVKTKYGHCSKLLVRVGESIHQGEVIAKVGSTGHSTGPHLHYEVVHEGMASNPEFFTRRR